MRTTAIENELDLQLCMSRLWRGKRWILGCTLVAVVLAWSYAQLAPQKWVAIAQLQRPDITSIKGYYWNSKKLTQLSLGSTGESPMVGETTNSVDAEAIIEPVYQRFLQQLTAIDNRRAFWQQVHHSQADNNALTPVLLEREVTSIQFTPGDKLRGSVDTITLQANNAEASSHLLQQYIEYTNQQVVTQITENMTLEWQTEMLALQQQIAFQQQVAQAAYEQQVQKLQRDVTQSGTSAAKIALSLLEQQGPEVTEHLLQDQARLVALQSGPSNLAPFKSWSYLQSPQPPVTRTSPRLLLLCVMWGIVGIIVGAGIALARRQQIKE